MIPLLWLSLFVDAVSTLTCDASGVLCVSKPTNCVSDCDFLLKYGAASETTTQIEMTGKPASYSLSSTSSIWLAFGFSDTGAMSGMTMYACQLADGAYAARKVPGNGYGVSDSDSTEINEASLVGTYADGVMTCLFSIDNSDLPTGNKKMAYGMGPMYGENKMLKHSKTPTRSADSLSLIQQYNPAECSKPSVVEGIFNPESSTISSGSQYTITCESGFTISGAGTVTCTDGALSVLPSCTQDATTCQKPDIPNGSVEPTTAAIESGSEYTASCNEMFTISGETSISCTNGQLSTLPTCAQNEVITCEKPVIQDGTVQPDTGPVASGETYTVTCNHGFTISDDSNIICVDGVLSEPFPMCSDDTIHSHTTCNRPDIDNGSVQPDSGSIELGEQYTVSCDEGFTISGDAAAACSDGSLNNLPSCVQEDGDSTKESNCTLANKCFRYPTDCEDSSCSFNLKWSEDGTKISVQVSGKPDDYSLQDHDNIWIGLGFSKYGTMTDSDIYLCVKTGETFSTTKVAGYAHGLRTPGDVLDANVVGSYSDSLISCKYSIQNTQLVKDLQPMFYGIGPSTSSGTVLQHSKTPVATTQKFSFLSDETSSSQPTSVISIILTLLLVIITAP